jgi:hypothetical protein
MSEPKWESVTISLERIRVPGGWLYRTPGGTVLCFVPEPSGWGMGR